MLFCARLLREAQPRAVSALLECVILAGSLISRRKRGAQWCQARSPRSPLELRSWTSPTRAQSIAARDLTLNRAIRTRATSDASRQRMRACQKAVWARGATFRKFGRKIPAISGSFREAARARRARPTPRAIGPLVRRGTAGDRNRAGEVAGSEIGLLPLDLHICL